MYTIFPQCYVNKGKVTSFGHSTRSALYYKAGFQWFWSKLTSGKRASHVIDQGLTVVLPFS
jgi:hypothetical protein